MSRVLITGGAGYIGDSVVEHLMWAGHSVVVIDNLMYGGSYMRGIGDPHVYFCRTDITDKQELEAVIRCHDIDAIVHLAAIVGDGACASMPERAIQVNEVATGHIAQLCAELDIRLVFASTCSVYGASDEFLTVEHKTNPLSIYAGTKLAAEKLIESRAINYVIFRLGTLFGLSSDHARIRCDLVANIMTYKATQGKKLTVFGGEQWRPLLHVRDAARIFAQAAVEPVGHGTYNLALENFRIIDIANQVLDTCFLNSSHLEITEQKFEDLRNYKVDTQKADAIGFCPTMTLDHGIAEMRDVVMEGRICDVWDRSFHNAKYAQEVLDVGT